MTYELKGPHRVTLECPFCGKKTISALFIPSILQSHTSRSAAKSITNFYRTKEKHEIQSGCSNCGKSAKEIQKALNEGKKNPENEKKILERLKKQGLDFSNVETKF